MSTTLREVEVSFSDNTVGFSGPGISGNEISIPTNRGQIVLRLKTQTPGARFPSSPIQWTAEEPATPPAAGSMFRSIAQPSEATVVRKSGKRTEIRINSPAGTRRFSFFVLVETSNGKFFGTDPTIVTMRPRTDEGGR